MVQALLDGRKTMTRRIIKSQPIVDRDSGYVYLDEHRKAIDIHDWENNVVAYCPYGMVGDQLWVRETFGIIEPTHATAGGTNIDPYYVYRADGDGPTWDEGPFEFSKWKPSIFMPRKACRIILEITDVCVERVGEISEQDAVAEGIQSDPIGDGVFLNYLHSHNGNMKKRKRFSNYKYVSAQESFSSLWQSINGNESWDANPWVWVIEFKRVK